MRVYLAIDLKPKFAAEQNNGDRVYIATALEAALIDWADDLGVYLSPEDILYDIAEGFLKP